jgi:hypothetical protein
MTYVTRMQMGYIKSNVTLNYFIDTNFETMGWDKYLTNKILW